MMALSPKPLTSKLFAFIHKQLQDLGDLFLQKQRNFSGHRGK